MPRFVLAAAAFLALAIAAPKARAGGSCTTAADVGSKVWKHAGPTVKSALNSSGPFGATAATAATFIEKGIKLWNLIAGDQTWAKIGPRRMDFGEWNQGTLVGPTERLFLSAIPAVNPVRVEFHKLDFDGEVKVVVCKVPEKGKAKSVATFTVDNKTKTGKVRTIEIADAKGHVISVVLHGKSLAKKLKYKVKASFDFEDTSNARANGTASSGVSESDEGGRTVSGARR